LVKKGGETESCPVPNRGLVRCSKGNREGVERLEVLGRTRGMRRAVAGDLLLARTEGGKKVWVSRAPAAGRRTLVQRFKKYGTFMDRRGGSLMLRTERHQPKGKNADQVNRPVKKEKDKKHRVGMRIARRTDKGL